MNDTHIDVTFPVSRGDWLNIAIRLIHAMIAEEDWPAGQDEPPATELAQRLTRVLLRNDLYQQFQLRGHAYDDIIWSHLNARRDRRRAIISAAESRVSELFPELSRQDGKPLIEVLNTGD